MDKIIDLLVETHLSKLFYKNLGTKGRIEAAACAIREKALMDALICLGAKKTDIEKILKE